MGHEGKATRLTKDHRPDDPDEITRIEQAGGFLFKGRVVGVLAITRSLGDHCMKSFVIAEPYCSETSITLFDADHVSDGKEEEDHDDGARNAMNNVHDERPEHFQPSFVICACDGLWDVFEDQEAVDFVHKYGHEREIIAEHLVNEAMRKGSTDNISVMVAWL